MVSGARLLGMAANGSLEAEQQHGRKFVRKNRVRRAPGCFELTSSSISLAIPPGEPTSINSYYDC